MLWPKVIAKQQPELLHFEVIDVVHAICQNQTNQNFTSIKNLKPLIILSHLLLFSFIIPLILFLYWYLITILVFSKGVRLYITKNRRQIVCLLDQINLSRRVNNISVTWNRAISQVQHSLRQSLQIPITDTILHYLTCDVVQRGWIKQKILIFASINIKIVTEISSPIPPICPCPKIAHILE